MKTKTQKTILAMTIFLIMVAMLPNASAKLELDRVSFDPAIISAGDTVDIIVQFHAEALTKSTKLGNPDYSFEVSLHPDDEVSGKYITILDSEGDNIHGAIYPRTFYSKVFRVKVSGDAIPADYQLRLEGRWVYKGVPEEDVQYVRFLMPVKKEGIIINIGQTTTFPSMVRAGDDEVKLTAYVENVGEKDAKSVEAKLILPDGFTPSYSSANRVWVGGLKAGESKKVDFYIDVDENLTDKEYTLNYEFNYMDYDNNKYSKKLFLPFLLKSRPYLNVAKVEGEGIAGRETKLHIFIRNEGTESAESVDVRIIKQNSQPFDIDVRSEYIGELEPGETGEAIFTIHTLPEAELKEYSFKLLIRAKGDSDEGDDKIYLFNRRANFRVSGRSPNYLLTGGVAGTAVLLLILAYRRWKK